MANYHHSERRIISSTRNGISGCVYVCVCGADNDIGRRVSPYVAVARASLRLYIANWCPGYIYI